MQSANTRHVVIYLYYCGRGLNECEWRAERLKKRNGEREERNEGGNKVMPCFSVNTQTAVELIEQRPVSRMFTLIYF